MTCLKGRMDPSNVTKLRLFADSGGFCSNPNCLSGIFIDFDSGAVHIGEIAHMISAGEAGPRSDSAMTAEERSQYENLILLCPRCHTIVDKAEENFPSDLLLRWKQDHKRVIANAFGVHMFNSREKARDTLRPLLEENHFIFQNYGPCTDESFNPESEIPAQWLRKIRTKLIPNNRRILGLCDANITYLTDQERSLLNSFRQHVDDFEAKHLGGIEQNGGQFPQDFDKLFS